MIARTRYKNVLIYLLTSVVLWVMQILVLIGLHFLKCTKFDQLILRKIIKIVATKCQILTLKCTKIDFGWGSAGELTALPPDPIAGFKGAYF